MHQMKSGGLWKTGIILGAVLSMLPAWAYALGLGRLVVHSSLDQPLDAEVDLINPTPQELQSLSPSLASRSDFEQAGIDRPDFLTDIKYTIAQHPDGTYFIKLTSSSSIREPFIHTLLQVDWAGGHLVREYTALLDPPRWVAGTRPEVEAPAETETVTQAPAAPSPEAVAPAAPEAPAPTQTASAPTETATTAPVTTESAPSEQPQTTETGELLGPPTSETTTAAAPEEMSPTPSAVTPSSWASASRYQVKNGDTLYAISRKLNADRNISAQQVMVALLRANPKAFFDHNINNLKTGRILRLPSRGAVEAVSRAEAAKEVHVQYDAWQEYKVRLAAASRSVTVPSESPTVAKPASGAKETAHKAQTAPKQPNKPAQVAAKSKPQATSKPQVATAAVAATPVAGDQDLLRIVRANLGESSTGGSAKAAGPVSAKAAAGGERHALTSKVATLEEQIEAKQLENKELSDRVGKMQKQVKNTERLIDIENKELAVSQNQASKPAAPAPQAAAPTPAPAKVAPKPVVRRPPVRKPIIHRPVPVPESPSLLESIIDSITGNIFTLALLGGVAVLGIGILSVYYLRRRRAKAEFEESILSGGSLNTDGASISDSGSQPAASDTSFLSDFSQGGMGNIHTDEVDPIAEAEVYLAYGRDEQAEEILKEAVVKDPHRLELKQKLLEIYHQRNDVGAFETLAEELYAQVEGKGGKVWEKVEEMGRKISPGNPMFRGGAPGAKTAGVAAAAKPAAAPLGAPRTTGPLADAAPAAFAKPAALEAEMLAPAGTRHGGAPDAGLNFDLGAPVAARDDVNFDIDMASAMASSEPAAPAAEVHSTPADSGFDLDFNLEDSTSTDDSNVINFNNTGGSTSEPSLDFGTATVDTPQADTGLSFTSEAGGDTPVLEFESATESGGASSSEDQSQWDETATKLDLAKAYIDMGDADGARSILDEVMSEGNESQKNQARELAAQIA